MPPDTLAPPEAFDPAVVHTEINSAMDGLDVRFRGTDEDDATRLRFKRVPGVTKGLADLEALASEIERRLFDLQSRSENVRAYLKGKKAIGIV